MSIIAGFAALPFAIVFALFFIFIFNGATYTDMEVLGVETNLPMLFIDSHREGDDDFIFYQFDIQAQTPLLLDKVVVSNESESKTFEHFNRGNYYVYLEDEEHSDDLSELLVFSSKVSFITRDTLKEKYWKEESNVKVTHFHETDLNVLFVFNEGNATVNYKFRDREIIYTDLLYYLSRWFGFIKGSEPKNG